MSFPIKLIHFFILFSLIISFFISVNLGWFPSDKLLTKYPNEISFSFKNNGKINNLYYSKGDTVLNGVVLATIYNNDLDKLEVKENLLNKKFKILDRALINSIKNGASEKSISSLTYRRDQILTEIKSTANNIKSIKPNFSIFYNQEFSGKILKINYSIGDFINAGDKLLIIKLYEPFYIVNKIVSVLTILIIFIYIFLYKKFALK